MRTLRHPAFRGDGYDLVPGAPPGMRMLEVTRIEHAYAPMVPQPWQGLDRRLGAGDGKQLLRTIVGPSRCFEPVFLFWKA